jgi:hypothetical protein
MERSVITRFEAESNDSWVMTRWRSRSIKVAWRTGYVISEVGEVAGAGGVNVQVVVVVRTHGSGENEQQS